MKKTKNKILDTSRLLFNNKGYSNVTIRMIALEMKISSGNLNYHFKKREDILEALYFEMVAVFDNRIAQLGEKDITFKTIKEDVHESLKRMLDYQFFWTDMYNILKLSDLIKSHFDKVYKDRYDGYVFLFQYLNEKSLIKDFEFTEERHLLIERMIGFSNTWLYNSFIYQIDIDDVYINKQTNKLLAMLYPYLTTLGKNEFNKTCPDLFS